MVSMVENAVMSSWRLRTSHQKRRDGAEQEERALRDKDCGPRRTHDVNNRRRRGGNKQQLNHHDGTTIMHHKDYAIGGNRGVEP